MPKLVIDKKVLEADLKYYKNLLMPIVKDGNGFTIAYNQKIKDEYSRIEKTSVFDVWLMMAKDSFKTVECSDHPVFIKTCLATKDKILFVSDKEDYTDNEYEGLNPVDMEEAILKISPTKSSTNISNATISNSVFGDSNS